MVQVWDGKPTYGLGSSGVVRFDLEITGWETSGVVRFDFGPLLQGQTRIAKLKIAYNSLIIGPRGLGL